MKIEGERESTNVEDRRGGGGGGMRMGRTGGVGIGGIVIAFIAAWLFGINPMTVLGLLGGGGSSTQAPVQQGATGGQPANDPQTKLLRVVLASTEDVWRTQLPQQIGKQYPPPALVLFSGRTSTQGCGVGETAAGPFYCPGDRKLYLDTQFFSTLKTRLGAPGDFAQAYVIAHEVGHHLQNVLGIMDKTDQLRGRMSQQQYDTQVSVRVELQADCLAGVWAHHAQDMRSLMQQGDLEEAITAAGAVGDDKLQRQSTGTARPETFTHGTSGQRTAWFTQGFKSGQIKQCDTFAVKQI
jgi:uncharacterized protein